MSSSFTPAGISNILSLILNNQKEGHIFGIPCELFFKPKSTDRFRMIRYGVMLESPIGVAAGPHTQMSQNIISSWLCGARYIELKTVQTLDNIEITKPCINMQDEGYNCEWSQELSIQQSFDEYLNAWIIIHLLKHKFGMNTDMPGVLFNMSVGYDMQGILNNNLQWFLEKMQNCRMEKEEKCNNISALYPAITDIAIPDCISNNVTLSTMHGCPPDEIEKIGLYLIQEKKLHTTIKLNPTLIGMKDLRSILNTVCGFKTTVPDMAFEHDLKYNDALKIIDSLDKSAKRNNVAFGIKLTNTLESLNHNNLFSEKESMIYMSGRALHPISINLAEKIRNDIGNSVDISFSAGADCFNVSKVIACNLKPVTVCSDILKPGGYGRLKQYLDNLQQEMELVDSCNIENFVMKLAGNSDLKTAVLINSGNYASDVLTNKTFQKDPFFSPDIKTKKHLRYFDCIDAPCIDSCPTNQDIPEYLWYAANARWEEALNVILRKNPFPSVLGMTCDHLCQTKCTRINYDSPVLIREVKRFISEKVAGKAIPGTSTNTGLKAAIIGSGPSGLSCAYFLRLAGFQVDVYESKDIAGGMISDAIPSFRLSEKAIQNDIEYIKSTGVSIHFNYRVNQEVFNSLQKKYQYIYLAIGAQKAKKMGIENEQSDGVIDPLVFLSAVRRKEAFTLGKNILVIGGGNTAIDVARTALRLTEGKGSITLIYRRTRNEMPADVDEIKELLQEGIEIMELTAPKKVIEDNNKVSALLCCRMHLMGIDSSGRLTPVEIENSEFIIPCDTIIPALGQERILDFIDENLIKADGSGQTAINNVFIGGDAHRGASTIVKAVGDGRHVAENIILKAVKSYDFKQNTTEKNTEFLSLMIKKSQRNQNMSLYETSIKDHFSLNILHKTLQEEQAIDEASRCLYCDELCNICVTVCPNRANICYEINPFEIQLKKASKNKKTVIVSDHYFYQIKQKFQVLNLADFCNDCGNCHTFCPTSGSPYKDKPRLCLSEKSFDKENNVFMFKEENGEKVLLKKQNGELKKLYLHKAEYIFESMNILATFEERNFNLKTVHFKNDTLFSMTFEEAAEMYVLYNAKKYFKNLL